MKKVLHITRSFNSPSETFVNDLALRLHHVYTTKVLANKLYSQSNIIDASEVKFLLKVGRCGKYTHRVRCALGGNSVELSKRQRIRFAEHVLRSYIIDFQPDLIYTDYGNTGVLLKDLARLFSIPLVVHFHGVDASRSLGDPWYCMALSELMSEGAQIIVPSYHMERLLRIQTGTTRPIDVIPYGPNLENTRSLRNNTRVKNNMISAVGRLTPKKNPLALLEAFRIVKSRVPDATLEWVGDGELRKAVEQRIHNHGLQDSVILHGAFPHQEALKIMAGSQVFAQHSVTAISGDQEGLPVSILEAISMGVPVVSTYHSGIPEAVIHGENGFLVREHDYESMADFIVRLLEDPEILPGSDRATERFDENIRFARISTIFDELMKKS